MAKTGAVTPQYVLPMPSPTPGATLTQNDIDTKLKDYRTSMDTEFGQVKARSSQNYTINVTINAVIVALGVLLVLISIYHGLTTGADLFSGITSAIGVADFATIFLVNPQDKIRRALADFAQMQVIYSTWANQTAAAYLKLANSNFANVDDFETSLTTFANQAVSAIENNIGAG